MELAAEFGLLLDPWQAYTLERGLAIRDNKWAAFEVGLCVARQNGKGGILEARQLSGLFLIRERLQIHSSHQFDTSLEAFRRLLALIEGNPEAERRIKRVSRSHGEEGIELKGGIRIRFRTRTKGGGRGFTGDTLYLDEAMILALMAHGALLPTLSARPNPQVWYVGSAVDQRVHEDGLVFARVRKRGLAGGDQSLVWLEWSAPGESPDDITDEDRRSIKFAAQGNPGLGIRITRDHIANEQASMDPRTFAVERLGVGDWPTLDDDGAVISIEKWLELVDTSSQERINPVWLAYEVPLNRASASIGIASRRVDGLIQTEVLETRPGTGWVAARLAELVPAHKASGVLHAGGSSKTLVPELEGAGVTARELTAGEYAQACGLFFDKVDQGAIRHLGTSDLVSALRVAVKRPLGNAWCWDRRTAAVDISPLVVATLATWGAATLAVEPFALGW